MNNFGEILTYFKKEDILQNSILNHHYSKSQNKIVSLKIYSLINRIIQNIKNDLILVIPAKKEIAYLSSIFAALTFYKNDFQDRLKNFESWLKPNINVMLCSSGSETGKIYKYLGRKNNNFITLGSIIDNSIKIDHKIDTLLQLSPIYTNNISEKNIGKTGYIPKPTETMLDKLLDLKSYNNPLLYKNKIIVLTNFYNQYSNFLNNEIIFPNKDTPTTGSLIDWFTTGQMNEEGILKNLLSKPNEAEINSYTSIEKNNKIEPLIIYSKFIDSIYEYSSKTEDEKVIICDDIEKLNLFFPVYQQIKDNNKNFKFLILAEENEFMDIKEFKKKNNIDIWKLNESEITEYINDIKLDNLENFNDSSLIKVYLKSKNQIFKNDFYLEIEDNEFNKIDFQLKNIYKNLFSLDEIKKDRIVDLTKPLYYRMYQLRDYIFGFTPEIIQKTKEEIDEFFISLNTMRSNLENEIFDDLVELGNSFKNLNLESLVIFEKRRKELFENIKLREKDSKNDYAILAYNSSRKNYYEENIKKNWGLDVNVIFSINTSKTFKNLIVPSELAPSKISELLLSNNFENIYFIGSKSLKQEMNKVKSALFNRWAPYKISNEKKCDITNLNKNYSNAFFTSEQMTFPTKNERNNFTFNIENYFKIRDFSRYKEDSSGDDTIKVPAFLIIFNGESYAFFTEGFSTYVYNSIFDSSAFDKKKAIKKDFRNILIGDIILLRNRTDSDVLDQESIALLKDENKYQQLKNETSKIPNIINNVVGPHRDIFYRFLKKAKYEKGIGNVLSLADIDGGIICPNSFNDLKKIFLACEMMSESKINQKFNFKYNEQEAKEIFFSAKKYKSLRLSAGFSVSRKLKDALIKSHDKNIEFDGNPLRVDYINGEVIFGSSGSGIPEGYIVQVKNYEEPRNLKETKKSSTNRLIFL